MDTLVKLTGEGRYFSMDFSELMVTGESITGVVSVNAAPSGLTFVGTPTYDGQIAQQRISGGSAGVKYRVSFLVTTSGGNTVQGDGYLLVKDN